MPHTRANPMPDEGLLREKAREAIQSGTLPTARPSRTFGGPGSTHTCSLCAEPIGRDRVELEIEFDRPSLSPDVHHLHPRCFAAWEFERTKFRGVAI
jgi:hypothetical protein